MLHAHHPASHTQPIRPLTYTQSDPILNTWLTPPHNPLHKHTSPMDHATRPERPLSQHVVDPLPPHNPLHKHTPPMNHATPSQRRPGTTRMRELDLLTSKREPFHWKRTHLQQFCNTQLTAPFLTHTHHNQYPCPTLPAPPPDSTKLPADSTPSLATPSLVTPSLATPSLATPLSHALSCHALSHHAPESCPLSSRPLMSRPLSSRPLLPCP